MNNTDIINEAFENGITDDNKNDVLNAVTETISSLDRGKLRVAENKDGQWTVNEWAKKAILLSFRLNQNKAIDTGYTKSRTTILDANTDMALYGFHFASNSTSAVHLRGLS